MEPRDYIYIQAWGLLLASNHDYIRSQQELASQSKAPSRAIYLCDNGTWATVENCVDYTKAAIEMLAR